MTSKPSTGLSPEVIAEVDDPWIQAYLRLRQAVVDGVLDTQAQVSDLAAELRGGMPEGCPPPLVAALIAADIRITFPLAADALWTPPGAERAL